MSAAAMIQHFQGSMYEAALNAAQGEIMHLGEDFDVQADFVGLLRNIRRDAIETEMSALLAKGLGGMSQAERERHEQLKQELQHKGPSRLKNPASGTLIAVDVEVGKRS